jgi:hypothetical protein
MGCSNKDSAWLAPLGQEAQTAEAVGDELKAPKVNDFTEGKATAHQAFTVDGDGEHLEEKHIANRFFCNNK